MDGINLLVVAGALFVLTHLGLSSRTVRPSLVKVLGESGFAGFYSLVTFVTIGLLIYQYGKVSHEIWLWVPSMLTATVAKLIMPFALILVVLGVTAKNPTAMKQEAALDTEPAGILRVTRHPVQWGILLWALAHLIANGDLASIAFLLPFVIVSGLGSIALDGKKARTLDPAKWQHYTSLTSNVPFAAILAGRNEFRFSELGTAKIIIALALMVVLVYFHEAISGVPLYAF